jgi:hypothetical protein
MTGTGGEAVRARRDVFRGAAMTGEGLAYGRRRRGGESSANGYGAVQIP